MRIGLVQMNVESGNRARNIEHGLELMDKAASGADLVVLPELWTVGYDFRDLENQVTRPGDGLLERLSALARHHGVTLAAGSLPLWKEGNIFNTAVVFAPDGHLQATYSKRHLFYGYLEAELMRPGRERVITKINGISCGMAICFELYFPKMFQRMARDGATMTIVPASWPENHIRHWEILARARAIENGMYICAVNMVGTYHHIKLGGHSMFIDPEGYAQVEGDDREHIYYGEYEEEKYGDLSKTQRIIHLDKSDKDM